MCICFSNFKPRWNYDSSTFLFLPLRSERNVRDMILRKTSQINFMSELLLELGVHKSICRIVNTLSEKEFQKWITPKVENSHRYQSFKQRR